MAGRYPFKRDFYEDVVESIQKHRATFVLGPRKCGKTVCLKQIEGSFENSEYIDFKEIQDDMDSQDVFLKVRKSIENDEDKIYLLDEITHALNPEANICILARLFS